MPKDAKPVTAWSDPDEALYDVASRIERAVTDLQQQRRRTAEQEQRQRQTTERQKRGNGLVLSVGFRSGISRACS